MRDRGVLLLLVPSVTDINGAGGVAARWREYTRELERDGWRVELWTVDATDPARTIPRYHLANFPDTLTDAPGIGFVAKVWSRLRVGRAILPAGKGSRGDEEDDSVKTTSASSAVRMVVMTDLFSNVPLSILCAGAGVPLVYSIHTDIAQLDGIDLLPSSAAFLQSTAASLAAACVTTSPSFMAQLQSRGVARCDRFYRPLPVDRVARCAERLADADVARARAELTAGHPDRPTMAYVGRWSAEKRLHLLVAARPAGTTLAFVGDGPMGETVESWSDPPRVVVLRGMRPREELAATYRAADWVVSASAFETFGNVPYEAAHCGTPALLQDAQGFRDQIDDAGDRGALLRFEKDPKEETRGGEGTARSRRLLSNPPPGGEAALAEAMDRTAPLLGDPERVKRAARAHAMNGTTIAAVCAEIAETRLRRRRARREGADGGGLGGFFAALGEAAIAAPPVRVVALGASFLAAAAWAVVLGAILAAMKVFMVGGMLIGVDFTTGMAHQRAAKRRWSEHARGKKSATDLAGMADLAEETTGRARDGARSGANGARSIDHDRCAGSNADAEGDEYASALCGAFDGDEGGRDGDARRANGDETETPPRGGEGKKKSSRDLRVDPSATPRVDGGIGARKPPSPARVLRPFAGEREGGDARGGGGRG